MSALRTIANKAVKSNFTILTIAAKSQQGVNRVQIPFYSTLDLASKNASVSITGLQDNQKSIPLDDKSQKFLSGILDWVLRNPGASAHVYTLVEASATGNTLALSQAGDSPARPIPNSR